MNSRNFFVLLILAYLLTTTAAHCQTMQKQKTCYDQAVMVESKAVMVEAPNGKIYGTQWTNHYDRQHDTCWLLEVWFEVFDNTVHERVRDAFTVDILPEAEVVGRNDGSPIDRISHNEICTVHSHYCNSVSDFGMLLTSKYGFPDGVTIGMISEAQLQAQLFDRKFKADQAAKGAR